MRNKKAVMTCGFTSYFTAVFSQPPTASAALPDNAFQSARNSRLPGENAAYSPLAELTSPSSRTHLSNVLTLTRQRSAASLRVRRPAK